MPLRYDQKAHNMTNENARALLNLMEKKRSNLCVAVDVETKRELLEIVDKVGPYVAIVKTHIDILQDFTWDVVVALQKLQQKHNFLIFEDRKFADIGNTAKLQYSGGIYKISSWADITNAHSIPGDGIVEGMKQVGLPLGRSLLLLAEMSSAGNLATGSYTDATLQMARRHLDFVVGFIASRRLGEEGEFITLTPGVGLDVSSDGLGQRYRTPKDVIGKGSDIIIVGRGIYGKGKNIEQEAQRYQRAGWEAYESLFN